MQENWTNCRDAGSREAEMTRYRTAERTGACAGQLESLKALDNAEMAKVLPAQDVFAYNDSKAWLGSDQKS